MSDNEWYTPSKYVEAARQVMGSIDLDPASCALANETVKADTYYTKEQDGLQQEWYGNVWLNPPYGRINQKKGGSKSNQQAFAEKLLHEYHTGAIHQALLLTLGNPNCVWFQPFFYYLICFNRGTISFHRVNGNKGTFGFPLAFVYLGPQEKKFQEIFSQFGPIVKRVA